MQQNAHAEERRCETEKAQTSRVLQGSRREDVDEGEGSEKKQHGNTYKGGQ